MDSISVNHSYVELVISGNNDTFIDFNYNPH